MRCFYFLVILYERACVSFLLTFFIVILHPGTRIPGCKLSPHPAPHHILATTHSPLFPSSLFFRLWRKIHRCAGFNPLHKVTSPSTSRTRASWTIIGKEISCSLDKPQVPIQTPQRTTLQEQPHTAHTSSSPMNQSLMTSLSLYPPILPQDRRTAEMNVLQTGLKFTRIPWNYPGVIPH